MLIQQLSKTLPKKEYSTEKLVEAFPCKLPEGIKWNVLNLGVAKRYLINHPVSEDVMSESELIDLCSGACEKAIQKAGLSIKKIDYFVAAYDVNPFLSPGLSQLLVRNVGFSPYIKHVNAQGIASTAFPKALELSENYLANHPKDHVLICVSGVSSYWFHNQVRGLKNVMEMRQIKEIKNKAKREMELRKWVAIMQYFLFGDGVAAAVLAREGEGLEVKKIVEITNVNKKDYLAGYSRLAVLEEPFKFGFHSYLDREIPELGVKYTGLVLKRLLGRNAQSKMKKAKKWVVHTGSEKILNALAAHNGIEKEKLRESHEVLKEYGNLSGASLPFILERVVSTSRLSENDVVLMLGYGWGFSASASILEYKKRN
jgi:predicted naringenin-chalcone synthase